TGSYAFAARFARRPAGATNGCAQKIGSAMSPAPRPAQRPAPRPAQRTARAHSITHLLTHLRTHLLTRFIRYLCESLVRTPQATEFQGVTSRLSASPVPEMSRNVHVLVKPTVVNMLTSDPTGDQTCIRTSDRTQPVTMCQFVSMFS